MLIKSFPAGPWATNCYLVANEANSECIIIDPGFESLQGIKRIAEQFGLHPVATLLTHGHMDHVWSVVPLCKEHNIAAYLHSDDEWMVNEPEKAYSKGGWQEIVNMAGGIPDYRPDELKLMKENRTLDLAGIKFKTHHAPVTLKAQLFLRREIICSQVMFYSIEELDEPIYQEVTPAPWITHWQM